MFLYSLLWLISQAAGQCQAGTAIGTFIIQQPNRSTVVVVGSPLVISWTFTPLVTTLPGSIDISLADATNSDGRLRFSVPILKNFTTDTNSTSVIMQPLNDGQYVMRIGISNRDPFLNLTSCLQDGEAYGGSSSPFKVVNAVAFPAPKADHFGPSKNSAGFLKISLWITLLCAISIL